MDILDYDQKDFFEYFRIRFIKDIVQFENMISALQNTKDFNEVVDTIFRIFHNLKASSQYLGMNNIAILAHKVECVISSIKYDSSPPGREIILWLHRVKEQMMKWGDVLENNMLPRNEASLALLNTIVFGKAHVNKSTLFKQLNIVYMDNNRSRANKIVSALNKTLERVISVESLSELTSKLDQGNFHICMLNTEQDNISTSLFCKKNYPKVSVITIFDNLNKDIKLELIKNDIHNILANPLRADDLKKMLLEIIETKHINYSYLIDNYELEQFIKKLDTIPEFIRRIIDICDNSEKSIKDLIYEISNDTIFSSYILEVSSKNKLINHELSLNQTIAHIGKQSIKSLALKKISLPLKDISLISYNITIDDFNTVSFLRKKLMLYWYSKISVSALSVLATTALIGNIGQLILAKTLIDNNKSEVFLKDLKSQGILFSEERHLHTSTARITSDIFEHWGLSSQIVDSVRYSDYPEDAPIEIHDLCLANHIVFQLIQLDGRVQDEVPHHIKKLLENNGLSLTPLESALQRINQQLE